MVIIGPLQYATLRGIKAKTVRGLIRKGYNMPGVSAVHQTSGGAAIILKPGYFDPEQIAAVTAGLIIRKFK